MKLNFKLSLIVIIIVAVIVVTIALVLLNRSTRMAEQLTIDGVEFLAEQRATYILGRQGKPAFADLA